MSQGVTAVQSLKAPFRKSALFSTPISEQLDEIHLPPDSWDCMSDDPIASLHYQLLLKSKSILTGYCHSQWHLEWLAAIVKPENKQRILWSELDIIFKYEDLY